MSESDTPLEAVGWVLDEVTEHDDAPEGGPDDCSGDLECDDESLDGVDLPDPDLSAEVYGNDPDGPAPADEFEVGDADAPIGDASEPVGPKPCQPVTCGGLEPIDAVPEAIPGTAGDDRLEPIDDPAAHEADVRRQLTGPREDHSDG